MPDEPLSAGLKNSLDAHGFPFQYAVVRYCEELLSKRKSVWRFEVAEFPVGLKDSATHIDFVLHAKSEYSEYSAYLVCECKRPNPSIGNWAFIRAPYTRRNRTQRFTVFDSIRYDESSGRLFAVPLKLRDLTQPYDLGMELKGDMKGDAHGPGRGAIDAAAAQVFRGLGGLIDFFKDNVKVLHGQALMVPVIFTTARLYTSEVDLGAAELTSGTLPAGLTMSGSPWLWFQYNLSSALRHSATREVPAGGLTSLGSVLEYQHARSIAVVSPTGIESFLAEMPRNLEDLETLKA